MSINFHSRNNTKPLAFYMFMLVLCIMLFQKTYADFQFSSTSATGLGSSNSVISVNNALKYVNKGDNSSIVHNYFEGYYHDSRFGYFKTDWSPNPNLNVRIVGSTNKCNGGYGYKLGGFAESETGGFVDFDHNQDIFVYYCSSNGKLHGYAYSDHLGYQNFEGILLPIQVPVTTIITGVSGTGSFTNNSLFPSSLLPASSGVSGTSLSGNADNSNFTQNEIQHDLFELEADKENTFYIIK